MRLRDICVINLCRKQSIAYCGEINGMVDFAVAVDCACVAVKEYAALFCAVVVALIVPLLMMIVPNALVSSQMPPFLLCS